MLLRKLPRPHPERELPETLQVFQEALAEQ
jgi:hypothetical protein